MTEIHDLTFEQAYGELTQLLETMEAGDLPLEQSVELYERGKLLAAHCDDLLEKAELRVKQLNADGTTEDFA